MWGGALSWCSLKLSMRMPGLLFLKAWTRSRCSTYQRNKMMLKGNGYTCRFLCLFFEGRQFSGLPVCLSINSVQRKKGSTLKGKNLLLRKILTKPCVCAKSLHKLIICFEVTINKIISTQQEYLWIIVSIDGTFCRHSMAQYHPSPVAEHYVHLRSRRFRDTRFFRWRGTWPSPNSGLGLYFWIT